MILIPIPKTTIYSVKLKDKKQFLHRLIPIPKMLVDKDDDRNAVCQGGR